MAIRKPAAGKRQHDTPRVPTTVLRRDQPVDEHGNLVVSAELRRITGIEAGDELRVDLLSDGSLLVRPVPGRRDPDQWWFWTDEWFDGEREVGRDIAVGEGRRRYLSTEEFLAGLDRALDEARQGKTSIQLSDGEFEAELMRRAGKRLAGDS